MNPSPSASVSAFLSPNPPVTQVLATQPYSNLFQQSQTLMTSLKQWQEGAEIELVALQEESHGLSEVSDQVESFRRHLLQFQAMAPGGTERDLPQCV